MGTLWFCVIPEDFYSLVSFLLSYLKKRLLILLMILFFYWLFYFVFFIAKMNIFSFTVYFLYDHKQFSMQFCKSYYCVWVCHCCFTSVDTILYSHSCNHHVRASVCPSVRSHFRNRYLSFYWKKWFYIWYMALAWWLVLCLPFPGLPCDLQMNEWGYS